jgi:GMP synthase-like glutamine amidotransferase
LSYLAESVEHASNTTPPLAGIALASSLLAKDLGGALEEQTEDIIEKLK